MFRRLHFNLFLHDTGHHEASWRLPEADPHANLSLEAHQHLARVAEDAMFDSVFLADSPVLWGAPGRRPSGKLEPTLLLAALAVSTSRIGLIATASTSYNEPYNVADTIQHYFENGAADGFNIMPAVLPSGIEAFAAKVVPILRERGLFRSEYEGTTLREHYGLPRPVNQFAEAGRGTSAQNVRDTKTVGAPS